MSQQTEPQVKVEIDTSGLKAELEKFKFEIKQMVKESVTPPAQPASINEGAVAPKTNWRLDYKKKVVEAIKMGKPLRSGMMSQEQILREWGEVKATQKDIDEFDASIPKNLKESLQESIPNITTTNATPDVWAADTERLHVYPNSIFLRTPGLVRWDTTITEGRPGVTVEVVTVDKAIAVDVTEGSEPTTNAATVSKVQIALKTAGAAFYLKESDVEDLVPSTIDALNEGLGAGIAEKVDTDFLTWIDSPASGSNTRGTLTTAQLGTVNMSGSILARAIGSMKAGTYQPAFYLCHPITMVKMMDDQQFYDASQFGNRDVIERGAIANYYGVDIIEMPNMPNSGGTYKSFLLAKNALVGVIKRKPVIRTDYVIEAGNNYVRMTMRYGGTVVHGDGVFEINTYD